MGLIRMTPQPVPRLAGWLVPGHNCTDIAYQLVNRAFLDVGILEVPNGSNRGTRIDAMAARLGFHFKPGQDGVYWCAIWAACVAADCGLMVPDGASLTDQWLPFVKAGKWDAVPEVGDFILYGLRRAGPVVNWGDSHHIGLIVRAPEPESDQELMLTIEGNRAYAGTTSNNGVAVDIGPCMRKDILGYVSPKALQP